MTDNVCSQCIQKEYENPKIGKCPECGQETCLTQLDGPSMLIKCDTCGYEVVGASFFPPCKGEDMDYTITVKAVTKEQNVPLAKLFGRNVMEMQKEYLENGQLRKTTKLRDVITIKEKMMELGVSYDISPAPTEKYPDFMRCKFRI